jgi:hypothetical protein
MRRDGYHDVDMVCRDMSFENGHPGLLTFEFIPIKPSIAKA